MQEFTSSKRKSFKRIAIASVALLATGSVAAVLTGVTPATAASLASQPDTQIAVFMVPLTILVIAVLYEVTRTVLRGSLPAEAPARQRAHRHWSPGQTSK